MLVDISVKPNSINPNDHPDLKLPKDKLRTGLGVAEQALLVNAAGKLVAFDPVSMLGSYRVTKKDYEDEQEDFDSIKQDGAGAGPGEPGSDLTGIGAMYQQGAAASAQNSLALSGSAGPGAIRFVSRSATSTGVMELIVPHSQGRWGPRGNNQPVAARGRRPSPSICCR